MAFIFKLLYDVAVSLNHQFWVPNTWSSCKLDKTKKKFKIIFSNHKPKNNAKRTNNTSQTPIGMNQGWLGLQVGH